MCAIPIISAMRLTISSVSWRFRNPVQISSASHPFFTGEENIIDTEGRVDRFKARAERAAKLRDSLGNKAKKAAKESEKKAEKAASEINK